MIALQSRLRELSKEEFECFVHQFLLAKFPGGSIKKVDGTGGDRGIDSFSGILSDGPAVWQSKHFTDRIRRPQKKQILSSIETAMRSGNPKRWTLCVPIDLRTEEHEWFQSEVVSAYKDRCPIELIGGSEFLAELALNRPLRDAFFPNESISNALSIRKIATGTEGASLDQKEQLAIEIAQQFLEGNIDLEPRLDPVFSVGISKAPPKDRREPGLVFSVTKGNLAIDYFARDPSLYSLDPISVQITMNRSHSRKLLKSINTGAPFKLPVGGLLKLDSESPLLRQLFREPDASLVRMEMRPMIPEALAAKVFPLRLVAGPASDKRELACVQFKVTQFGRKEITLASTSNLPIEISLKLKTPPSQGASVSFHPLIPGADSVELARIFEFFDALERSQSLEIFSLDPPGPLLNAAGAYSNRLSIHQAVKKAVLDASVASSFFETPLRIPDMITEDDLRKLQTLRQIATGEPLTGFEISASLVKDSALMENALLFLSGAPTSIRMENPTGWQRVTVFGKTIDPGRVAIAADGVTVIDGERIREQYLNAPEGAQVGWKGKCNGLCRFISIRKVEGEPLERYGRQ